MRTLNTYRYTSNMNFECDCVTDGTDGEGRNLLYGNVDTWYNRVISVWFNVVMLLISSSLITSSITTSVLI